VNQSAISLYKQGLVSGGDAASELPREGGRDEPSLKVDAGNVASLARVWDTRQEVLAQEWPGMW